MSTDPHDLAGRLFGTAAPPDTSEPEQSSAEAHDEEHPRDWLRALLRGDAP